MREGVTITNCLVPKEFKHERGRLIGVVFEKVKVVRDEQGGRRLQPTGEPDLFLECDDVLIAVGQETAFPWIERDSLVFDESGRPQIDPATLQSSHSKVFFGGDAATGAKNIVSAVASGRQAAISIHLFCQGIDPRERPNSQATLLPYAQDATGGLSFEPSLAARFNVPVQENAVALARLGAEVELGFDLNTALQESRRCLNCDIETIFAPSICIECRACVEICPTQCITFTKDGEEADVRTRLSELAKNLDQPLYIANGLQSGRVMVKDENVCLHCGYCAEHCPTGAWQMQRFFLHTAKADDAVSSLAHVRTA
jgi:ferredoxin